MRDRGRYQRMGGRTYALANADKHMSSSALAMRHKSHCKAEAKDSGSGTRLTVKPNVERSEAVRWNLCCQNLRFFDKAGRARPGVANPRRHNCDCTKLHSHLYTLICVERVNSQVSSGSYQCRFCR